MRSLLRNKLLRLTIKHANVSFFAGEHACRANEMSQPQSTEVTLNDLYYGLAAFIMLNVILGGFRIAVGPSRTDRMLASQFLGTSAVGLFLILAEVLQQPSLRNIALIFVALAALTSVAFVKSYASRTEPRTND
jgi:multicomponent Na+:H+ antiporter subunit F